jgi:hypothetical protein
MVPHGGSEARTVGLVSCAHGNRLPSRTKRKDTPHRKWAANVGDSPNPGDGSNISTSQ